MPRGSGRYGARSRFRVVYSWMAWPGCPFPKTILGRPAGLQTNLGQTGCRAKVPRGALPVPSASRGSPPPLKEWCLIKVLDRESFGSKSLATIGRQPTSSRWKAAGGSRSSAGHGRLRASVSPFPSHIDATGQRTDHHVVFTNGFWVGAGGGTRTHIGRTHQILSLAPVPIRLRPRN